MASFASRIHVDKVDTARSGRLRNTGMLQNGSRAQPHAPIPSEPSSPTLEHYGSDAMKSYTKTKIPLKPRCTQWNPPNSRHFHANPNLLPSAGRHYCSISLKRLLGSRPSVRRRWLRRVRTARSNLIKNGKTQQLMTQFSTEQTTQNPPRNISATAPNRKNNSNVRSVTTQQRMTAFFPGRPPDSTDKKHYHKSTAC